MLVLVAVAILIGLVAVVAGARSARADSRRKGIVEDPVLGTLHYDSRVRGWRAAIEAPSGRIGFVIRGENEPAAALVSHAREIASSAESFQQSIRDYLEHEAVCQDVHSDEIRALKLDTVCLFWPDRPADGIIHFAGPNDGPLRIWLCDYVERTPLGLRRTDD